MNAPWPSAHPTANGPARPLAPQPPLVNLARQHLAHDTVSFEPAPETMRLCAMYTGVGLDHLGGEEPVALIHEPDVAATTGAVMGFMNDNWDAEHFVGALLTTRRFILGNLDPVCFPLEGIAGAQIRKGLMGGLELMGIDPSGRPLRRKEDLGAKAQLASFFGALCQMHPQQRPVYPQTTELAFPSPRDPTGAQQALATEHARLPSLVDPRVPMLLQIVAAAVPQGMQADIGVDMVRRIVLFAKNLRSGRGQQHGFWLSPLTGEDFEQITATEFQRCTRRFVDAQGILQVEYRWDSSLAQAAASSAAGAASEAIFGLGWSETPVTTETTVRLRRFEPVVGFQLRACSGDRFTVAPRGDDMGFVQDAHEAIATHEARALLLRAVFGWQNPLGQLMAVPMTELQNRCYQLLGHGNLAPFYP